MVNTESVPPTGWKDGNRGASNEAVSKDTYREVRLHVRVFYGEGWRPVMRESESRQETSADKVNTASEAVLQEPEEARK
jgi:hypothetical protein